MGTSFKKQDTTVNELIANGFPVSAKVGALGIAVALAAGIPLGIVAAVKRGKLADGASMVLATIGVSVPSFVLCVLMMYVFCEKWKIFPSYGLTSWKHYVLPVFCMAFSQVAYITRLMRSSMLETMRQDYIRTERSKGVPEWEVISKYALKNSILPVVTYVGPAGWPRCSPARSSLRSCSASRDWDAISYPPSRTGTILLHWDLPCS